MTARRRPIVSGPEERSDLLVTVMDIEGRVALVTGEQATSCNTAAGSEKSIDNERIVQYKVFTVRHV
jgi:hypothetical protein